LLLGAGYEHGEAHRSAAGEIDLLLHSNIEYAFVIPKRGASVPARVALGLVWRWPGARAAAERPVREARHARFVGSPGYALSPEWELLFLATILPATDGRGSSG